jgi:hypothetical protein
VTSLLSDAYLRLSRSEQHPSRERVSAAELSEVLIRRHVVEALRGVVKDMFEGERWVPVDDLLNGLRIVAPDISERVDGQSAESSMSSGLTWYGIRATARSTNGTTSLL